MKKLVGMLLLVFLIAPAVGAQVRDLAGGPEAPQAPAGPGGPIWNAPEAVLFDNGPIVTNPGGGFGGADLSALQTALGLNTLGFGHQLAQGYRVADDFVVPSPGWQVNTITFFAYQTGSTTTSTIDAVNLQIWNGEPGVAGSTVVWGDTTTNRLAGTSFTNIYRATDAAPTGNTRPIMADVVTVNTFLAPGTYWLDWQTGGTLASGPWASPVSILGQAGKPGANALQYTTAWAPLVDTGTAATAQDLPFIIDGVQQSVIEVPTLSAAGLALLGMLLGAASVLLLRRRAA